MASAPEGYHFLTFSGVVLILMGLALVLLPLLARFASLEALEKIPPIILYVYRGENFYFVTSPLLILISVAYLLWILLR